MYSDFLITDIPFRSEKTEMKFSAGAGRYTVYSDSENVLNDGQGITVIIHGQVQPVNTHFGENSKFLPAELVHRLYLKYGEKFIEQVKGYFVIIIIHNQKILLFTDHFGMVGCFIYRNSGTTAISNSFMLFRELNVEIIPVAERMAQKCILNRNVSGVTPFLNIDKIGPATQLSLTFDSAEYSEYWNPEVLIRQSEGKSNYNIDDFAELLKLNFSNLISYHQAENHVISLTAGKDSRTGLAVLKSLGLQPQGFTYGNPGSLDAVFASRLAGKTGLSHQVLTPPDTEDWYHQMCNEITCMGNPDISLHRAHRLYAFQNMSRNVGSENVYYCGNMGGEFLMGLYYDQLIFSDYLVSFWEHSVQSSMQHLLEHNFIRISPSANDAVLQSILEMKSMKSGLTKKERHFFGMFEIGIPHHAQDIYLAARNFGCVYPFFIDIDFLNALFASSFSFFSRNNQTANPFKRYSLYEFNLNIQHKLFPEMDTIAFGKRGTYNTREYLKGPLYWSFMKTLRYVFQRMSYPVSYSYGVSYKKFLTKILREIESDKGHILHEFFDVSEAVLQLDRVSDFKGEKSIRRYSNIIQLYLQLKNYQK